ncbi:MAG: TlpA disulfide reductase family protein [Phycisphaerae bacterium]
MNNHYDSDNNANQVQRQGFGLAITALILAVLSIPLSLVIIGGILGAIGFILAVVHIAAGYTLRRIALWGLGLSICGMALSFIAASKINYNISNIRDSLLDFGGSKSSRWVGKPAPELVIKDLDGKIIRLSELKGKKVIVDFWATWCPPCRKGIPHFIALANQYGKNELLIIGISSENEQTVRNFANQHGINYPLAATSADLPSPFGDVTALPTTFFIDSNGIIRNVVVGYHDFNELKKMTDKMN